MAMSKCPECGKELSNTVEKCIHCGCEVKICPECNQLALSNAESCPVCGFSFNKAGEIPPAIEETETEQALESVFETWEKKEYYKNIKKHLASKIITISKIILWIPNAIIIVIALFLSINEPNIFVTLKAPSVVAATGILKLFCLLIFICSLLISILKHIGDIYESFNTIRALDSFNNHSIKQRAKLNQKIAAALYSLDATNPNAKSVDRVSFAFDAAYYNNNPSQKKTLTVCLIIKFCIKLIASIFFCIFFIAFALDFATSTSSDIFASVFESFISNIFPFIVAISLRVIGFVLGLFYSESNEKKQNVWCSSFLTKKDFEKFKETKDSVLIRKSYHDIL